MSIFNLYGEPLYTGVNVREFGAKGDGTTDDATAIQNAIDSVSSGGMVFFPAGTYLIKTSIEFYSNQTLWFDDGAVLLQGGAINNLLRTHCESTWTGYTGTHDSLIYGATFDGGAYTTNNTLVGTVHAKNISFVRCTFKNAYGTWHDLEINSSYNVKVINCDFEGSRKTGDKGEMIQIDAALSSSVWPWDGANFDSTVSKYIEISGCYFHDDTVSPAIGNHSTATHQFIRIFDNIFDTLTGTKGAISFNGGGKNIDIHDNTFNGCTTGIGSSGATYYIHDNRFVGATTAISGSASVAHANMINGTFAA